MLQNVGEPVLSCERELTAKEEQLHWVSMEIPNALSQRAATTFVECLLHTGFRANDFRSVMNSIHF